MQQPYSRTISPTYPVPYLLDGDGRTPILLLVKKRQTDGSGRVHVGVEERRDELDLGRACRVLVLEDHLAFVEASLPRGALFAGDGELPVRQVEGAVMVLHRPGDEPERMVLPPGLALLGQSSLRDSTHGDSKLKHRRLCDHITRTQLG